MIRHMRDESQRTQNQLMHGAASAPPPPAPKPDKGGGAKGKSRITPGPFGNRSAFSPRTSNAPY